MFTKRDPLVLSLKQFCLFYQAAFYKVLKKASLADIENGCIIVFKESK